MHECPDCGYLSADPIAECPRCEDVVEVTEDASTAAIADDRPAPHYPCPQCMGITWRVLATFERGRWVDEDTYVDYDPPRLVVSSVLMSRADCDNCGYIVDLSTALSEE